MIQKIFREKQNSEAKISVFMTNEQIYLFIKDYDGRSDGDM